MYNTFKHLQVVVLIANAEISTPILYHRLGALIVVYVNATLNAPPVKFEVLAVTTISVYDR